MPARHHPLPPRRLCIGLLALALLVGSGAVSAATRLVRAPAAAPGLTELGLALDHSTREGDEVLFEATEGDVALMREAGIPYAVVIPDLESFYAERLQAERDLWQNAPRATGFGFGSMGGYYTWSEVVGKLDEMRASYPSFITAKQSLGLTHEGRDVWMVKISDNADADEGEPAILHTGLTHAREPEGMELLLYYMFYLLENYGTNPEATYLVNEREMVFVPVVNPDGYVYNQTTNPAGGGMWRKNRRVNGGGLYGVDLNRNYGYLWGYDNQGSSPTPSSDTYRGPGPFSEPETSAIRAFHQGRTIRNGFHYHAYGNWEIHPFAYAASAFPPEPDRSLFLSYGGEITAMNGFGLGNFWQTLRYLANGEVLDWSYGEQVEKPKVFAFLPEVGSASDGFWPPSSRIIPLAELNKGPNLYYAWIAGARVYLVWVTSGPEVPAGATSTAVVEVANRGLGSAAADVTLTLSTSDPYVTIANPVVPFPPVPALSSATNASDPLEFFVSAGTPVGHVITLDLVVKQGPVVRVTTTFQVTVGEAAAVASAQAPAAGFGLAARPNPVVAGAELTVSLPAAGRVSLELYDVAGRARRTLAAGEMAAGEHRIGFDGRDDRGEPLPSGMYLARLRGPGGAAAELRLVVLR